MTSTNLPLGIHLDSEQSPLTLWLAGFVAAMITFLAYLSYTPRVDERSPAFTSDTSLFIGSWGFYFRKWGFWKGSVERSKTGNFSFWLGKYHVVGVSGEAARKEFLDNRHLNFVNPAPLHGIGVISDPKHEIFLDNFHKGHSYFQRRILDLMKSEHLIKRLPRVTTDARAAFKALAENPSNVMDPADSCYRLVLKQACRIVCTDEISDTPELLDSYSRYAWMLMHCISGHTVTMPWLPSLSHMKRRYCSNGLINLVKPIIDKRMKKGAPRADDVLQILVDNGDSKDYIIRFFINALFIGTANAGIMAGGMLNIMAHHIDWQEKIYSEIKAAADAYSTNKDAPLIDQLDSIPLEAWESAFPTIELCFKEQMRRHVAFNMIRQNISSSSIPIPGTDEVIPAGGFVAYHTGDVHYNEKLYPKPFILDPFREDRVESKQSYDFIGWGNGKHRCVGQRWAKLQLNIILSYALATYEWSGCDVNGKPIPPFDHQTHLDTHNNDLPKHFRCKYIQRNSI